MSYIKVYPNIDADAQAFLTAAAITDPTISSSIDKLVVDLKAAGVWSKMKAIYPMVGGTASTHKFNLKDPRDLDAAFRLSFLGGWTHSANGALPNGTNAYANTFFNPVAQGLTSSNSHLSYYARTQATTLDAAEIANFSSATQAFVLQARSSSSLNRFFYTLSFAASRVVTVAPIGFINGSAIANTRRDLYLNGISVANNTSTDTGTLGNYSLYIAAGNLNNALIGSYSNAQCALASIGNGLSDTEAANLYTAVQNFQTTLNRQV
jgi:hypothetical protein